jgi:hypothetical protein
MGGCAAGGCVGCVTTVGVAVGRGGRVGVATGVGCVVAVGGRLELGIGVACLVCPAAVVPQEARILTRMARQRTTIIFFINVPCWDCGKRLRNPQNLRCDIINPFSIVSKSNFNQILILALFT